MIDLYCERIDERFWGEPLNAVTNGAFLIGVLICLAVARKGNKLSPPVVTLSVLLALIGFSSFAFHTLATRWAGALDALSILAFVVTFVFFYARIRLTARSLKAIVWVCSVPVAMVAFGWFGSSVGLPGGNYLGFVMIALGLAHQSKEPERRELLFTVLIFLVSFIFRSLDEPLCAQLPVGTHFLWHILNAWVCTRCILLIAVSRKQA